MPGAWEHPTILGYLSNDMQTGSDTGPIFKGPPEQRTQKAAVSPLISAHSYQGNHSLHQESSTHNSLLSWTWADQEDIKELNYALASRLAAQPSWGAGG